jgi:hypothetical protein
MTGYVKTPPFVGPIFTITSLDRLRTCPLSGSSVLNQAWPSANIAIFIPFNLEKPCLIRESFLVSGTLTTSNTIDIGVYDESFNRLFTSTMTVNAASTAFNSSSSTDVIIGPGSYYMAMACSGTRNVLGTNVGTVVYKGAGVMEQAGLSGSTLPATASPVEFTRTNIPLFGLNLQTVAL